MHTVLLGLLSLQVLLSWYLACCSLMRCTCWILSASHTSTGGATGTTPHRHAGTVHAYRQPHMQPPKPTVTQAFASLRSLLATLLMERPQAYQPSCKRSLLQLSAPDSAHSAQVAAPPLYFCCPIVPSRVPYCPASRVSPAMYPVQQPHTMCHTVSPHPSKCPAHCVKQSHCVQQTHAMCQFCPTPCINCPAPCVQRPAPCV
jgi:hypothetical protein